MAIRPIHHQRLEECLKILSVKPRLKVKGHQTNNTKFNCMGCYRASESQLWGYLEEARNNHRRLIRQHHPDRGGSHEVAAVLNAAWQRTKELFARKGFTLNN